MIHDGWPETRKSMKPEIVVYWDHRDQLSTYNDVVYRGERICIPQSLRKEVLHNLHTSHLGIVRLKHSARELLFWPGMNANIEYMVKSCSACLEFRNKNRKEPMKKYPVPDLPWSRVAPDLFQLYGISYIVIVDSYSGYIELERLRDTTATCVIKSIKENIARYGIMETLMTDNGPQFSCEEFRQFARTYKFEHTTSSPEYQQSNGLAERAVQSMKQMMKKCLRDGEDMYLAMLELRNTPRDALGSPSQRMMGRRTITLVPITHTLLKHNNPPTPI